ncbi:MAG: hypothetical protein JSS30_03340 [Verrucomicrobia bacterium]|nr:hypothetical protein [Verrucomicrobiota bacterium]
MIRRRDGLNLLLIYLVFFCYGLYGIADFIIDVFYPNVVAQIMRWPIDTPYQFETGMANLGFGVLGLLCCRFRNGFLLATIIGNTIWFWGDVVGQLMKRGWKMDVFYWSDALIPLLIWVVYFLRRKYTPPVQKGEQ